MKQIPIPIQKNFTEDDPGELRDYGVWHNLGAC